MGTLAQLGLVFLAVFGLGGYLVWLCEGGA